MIETGEAEGKTMEILGKGMSGESVTRLQERLKEFGFFNGVGTGYFDEATEQAVKAFQDAEGLASDGFVGLMTLHALNLLTLDSID